MSGFSIEEVAQIGSQLASTAMNSIINRDSAKLQFRHQKELNEQGEQISKNLWDYTNYENQVKHMENAGLNIGLMYGKGGQGGTTSGVGGGSASAPAGSMNNINVGQAMQTQAEIELAKAQARKLNVEADELEGKNARGIANQTIIELTGENLKQAGINLMQENAIKEWLISDEDVRSNYNYNEKYDYHTQIGENSQYAKSINASLLKTASETNKNLADINLTNQKILGYWTELLNETKKANAQGIQAAAQKLSAEWNTGEFTNWKTWADQAQKSIDAVGGLLKNAKSVNINKDMKNWKVNKY